MKALKSRHNKEGSSNQRESLCAMETAAAMEKHKKRAFPQLLGKQKALSTVTTAPSGPFPGSNPSNCQPFCSEYQIDAWHNL
jgi:hypothetical protein